MRDLAHRGRCTGRTLEEYENGPDSGPRLAGRRRSDSTRCCGAPRCRNPSRPFTPLLEEPEGLPSQLPDCADAAPAERTETSGIRSRTSIRSPPERDRPRRPVARVFSLSRNAAVSNSWRSPSDSIADLSLAAPAGARSLTPLRAARRRLLGERPYPPCTTQGDHGGRAPMSLPAGPQARRAPPMGGAAASNFRARRWCLLSGWNHIDLTPAGRGLNPPTTLEVSGGTVSLQPVLRAQTADQKSCREHRYRGAAGPGLSFDTGKEQA